MPKQVLAPSDTDLFGQVVEIVVGSGGTETVTTSLWWTQRHLTVLSGVATISGRMDDVAAWATIGTYSAGTTTTLPLVVSYSITGGTDGAHVLLAAFAQRPLDWGDLILRVVRTVKDDKRVLDIVLDREAGQLQVILPQGWHAGFTNKSLALIDLHKTLNTLTLFYSQVTGQPLTVTVASGSQRPVPDGDLSLLEPLFQPQTTAPSQLSLDPTGIASYQVGYNNDLNVHVADLVELINHQAFMRFVLQMLFPDLQFVFRVEES